MKRTTHVLILAVGLFLVWLALVGRVEIFDRLPYSIPLSALLLLAFPVVLVVAGILPAEDRRFLIDLVSAPGTTLSKLKESGT